jgi:hypothetical protein
MLQGSLLLTRILYEQQQALPSLRLDPREQQAALEHADLLGQCLLGLIERIELLTRLQVALGEIVEAVRGAQQELGQLTVDLGLTLEQPAGRCGRPAQFVGEFRHRLLGALTAQRIDRSAQGLLLALGAGDLLEQQIAPRLPQLLQLVVAFQLRAAQCQTRLQRLLLREQRFAPLTAQGTAGLPTVAQCIGNDGQSCLRGLDICLCPIGSGLGADDQTVGVGQSTLKRFHGRTALTEDAPRGPAVRPPDPRRRGDPPAPPGARAHAAPG